MATKVYIAATRPQRAISRTIARLAYERTAVARGRAVFVLRLPTCGKKPSIRQRSWDKVRTTVAKVVDSPEVLQRFEQELSLVEILVRQLARSFGSSMELDDLRSFGREGLLDAARRFDPERGVPFKAYANFRVRGAIIDGVRATGRLPRRVHARLFALQAASQYSEGKVEDAQVDPPPGSGAAQAHQALSDHLGAMATAMATGLLSETVRGEEGELTSVAPDQSPEEALGQAQLLHLVTVAIGELPEQEAELVRRHYLGGERFDHVAEELGLSKSWASRLHSRAIERLTKRLRARAA